MILSMDTNLTINIIFFFSNSKTIFLKIIIKWTGRFFGISCNVSKIKKTQDMPFVAWKISNYTAFLSLNPLKLGGGI